MTEEERSAELRALAADINRQCDEAFEYMKHYTGESPMPSVTLRQLPPDAIKRVAKLVMKETGEQDAEFAERVVKIALLAQPAFTLLSGRGWEEKS